MYVSINKDTWSHPHQLAEMFRKLHRQFGHASKAKLARTIKAAYPEVDHALLDQVTEGFECEICRKFQRDGPGPIASLPKVIDFNVNVVMDIFYVNQTKVLHVLDKFTHFARLAVVDSTKAAEVVQRFHECWTSIFGSPEKLRFDLGPEFDNEEFLELRDVLGCQLEAAGGGAHFAQGVIENRHGDLRDMIVGICEEAGCGVRAVLPEVNAAMNELTNVYGFSPAQLVFAFQPKLPHFPAKEHLSVDDPDDLPTVYRGYMRQKMEVLRQARVAMMQKVSHARIGTALRKSQRPDRRVFHRGEIVDYWTEAPKGLKRWRGPGKVAAVDAEDNLVFITSGGRLLRRHWKHVRPHQADAGLDIRVDDEDVPDLED